MEEISPIPGFDGYFASKSGNIYSTVVKYRSGPKKLTPYNNGHGYFAISFMKNGERIPVYCHAVVLLTFSGPMPADKDEIRHLNGDSSDNRLENLEYGTRQENMKDQMDHGRFVFGNSSKLSKITKDTAIEIARLFSLGESQKSISEKLEVSAAIVQKVVNGSTWSRDTGIPPSVVKRRVRPSVSEEESAKIKEMLSKGIKQTDIASCFGVSQSLVSAINRGARSKIRSDGGIVCGKIDGDTANKIVSRFNSGEKMASIARSLGVWGKTVSCVIKRHKTPEELPNE